MWPFSTIKYWKAMSEAGWTNVDTMTRLHADARKEIADLKASNERLADALAAAKERADDTWNA